MLVMPGVVDLGILLPNPAGVIVEGVAAAAHDNPGGYAVTVRVASSR